MPLFLFFIYAFFWTLIPALTLISPPLDVVEMLAWGQFPQWGYYKHPPLPAWFAEVAYQLAAGHVWGVYALSQICIAVSFWYVFRLGKLIFREDTQKAICATFFLTGIFYYSVLTPEFNHNIMQIPLWAAFTFYAARIYLLNKNDWLMLGVTAGFAMLAKYSSALLILSFVFVYFYGRKEELLAKLKNPWLYMAIAIAFLIFLPHLIWLIDNSFAPLSYAADRATGDASFFESHFINPFIFVFSQFINCLPAFLITLFALAKPFISAREKDERLFFLQVMCFGPLVITTVLGVVAGLELLPAWGVPFWNALGIYVFYHLGSNFKMRTYVKGLMLLMVSMLVLFGVYYGAGFSPRRSFPSEMLAKRILKEWKSNTAEPLDIIVSDEFIGGNTVLELPNRPKLFLRYDHKKAPWGSKDEVKRKGAVFMWLNYKPDEYPELENEQLVKVRKYNIFWGYLWPTQNKN